MNYPYEWSEMALQEIAILARGKFSARPRNDPKFFGGEIPFVQTGDVRKARVDLKEYSQTLNEAGLRVSKLFPKGTLLFTIAANIGEVAFLSFDGACPDSLVAINPKSGVSARWLYYQLGFLQPSFEAAATQNAQLNINLEKLNPFRIPVPPFKEQEAIAGALADADALIEGLARLIVKKRLIKHGAMQDLLTAKRRLPGFSGEWQPLNLASLSHLKARIGWQGLTTQEYRKFGEHILVTGTDIIAGHVNWRGCVFVDKWRFDQDRNIQLREGDILLTKDGTIGKVARVSNMPGPAALNSGVFVIRPKNGDYHPGFAFHILASAVFGDFLAKLTAGSTIVHLYQKDLMTFEFFAPDYEEQKAISDVLDDMDAEIQALETRLEKARQVKEGMMQNLLTGRIRLV